MGAGDASPGRRETQEFRFGIFRRFSGLRMFQKQFIFVFGFIREGCSRFGYHPMKYYREMLQATYRRAPGSQGLRFIDDRDIFQNQSSAALVSIFHLFSFGFFFSGEFREDLLRLRFSNLLESCQIVALSKSQVYHSYHQSFSLCAAPLCTATLFGLLAPLRTAFDCLSAPLRMRLALYACLLISIYFPTVSVRGFTLAVKFRSGSSTATPFRAHPSASVSVFRGGGGDHPT